MKEHLVNPHAARDYILTIVPTVIVLFIGGVNLINFLHRRRRKRDEQAS